MRVFVSGATGFVGRHVMEELKARGHTPVILSRPGSARKLPFSDGVEIVYGDIAQPETFEPALEEADAIIHLVAIIREFPDRGITFDKLNYQSVRNMVIGAQRAKVRRFILMSANGASPDGVSEYQITKWRAEELVRHSGLDWTIFRPSVIFGDSKGMPEFTSQLADVIRKAPVTPVFGKGDYLLDPVAVEDVAHCFVAALGMEETIGKAFCLGGGGPVPMSRVVQIIGEAVGKPGVWTAGIPFWLMIPVARYLGGIEQFPVTADQLLMLRQGNTCQSLDYMETFKLKPKPFVPGNLGYLS